MVQTSAQQTSAQQKADTLRKIIDSKWKFFHHIDFDELCKERQIVGPMPDIKDFESKRKDVAKLRAANTDGDITPFYQEPLLNKCQEQHLFRQMNYFKYRFNQIVATLDQENPSIVKMAFAEYFNERRNEIKKKIVCCNTRLASQVLRKNSDYVRSKNLATDMLAEAYVGILRAVDLFDWTLGYKFSTYATWALINNFNRDLAGERKFSDNFVTGFDETIYHEKEDNRFESDLDYCEQKEDNIFKADRLINMLDKVEDRRKRKIIEDFFGVGKDRKKKTLLEISIEMGLTKERVRQLRELGLADIRTRMSEVGWDEDE